MGDALTPRALAAAIREAAAQRGMNPTDASLQIAGHSSLIHDIEQAKSLPRMERLKQIAEFIGFELYFGPPRHDGKHRYDGSINYSGGLSTPLREALHLDADADEDAAIEAIRRLPRSSHQFMRWLKHHRRLRRELRAELDQMRAALARAEAIAGRLGEHPEEYELDPAAPSSVHDPAAPFDHD